MKVLLTTGGSRTSRTLIPLLLKKKISVLACVHSSESADKLKKEFQNEEHQNLFEIMIVDLLVKRDIEKAVSSTGVTTLFHVGPPLHPHENTMGKFIIDVVKSINKDIHFVYCSVFHPLLTKLLNHKIKLEVEEYLIESRLFFTILQPTHFMNNTNLKVVAESGKIQLGCSTQTLQGFVDLEDVAEVAVIVISNPNEHFLARYELVGENATYDQFAEILSQATSRSIVASSEEGPIPPNLANILSDEYRVDALKRLRFYYSRWGIPGNNNILKWILNRQPTSLKAFAKREWERVQLSAR